MAAWIVTLRGIGYRPGRSLVVLLLAAAATAATVLAPGYARAAQQSVLADALATAPADATSLLVTSTARPGEAPAVADTDEAKAAVTPALTRRQDLAAHLERPVASASVESVLLAVDGASARVAAQVAYRDSVCRRLTMTSGQCRNERGFVVISDRSAQQYKITVGSALVLRDRDKTTSPNTPATLEVSGLYTPKDPSDPYWGRGGYFAAAQPGSDAGPSALPRMDAVFVGNETDLGVTGGAPTVSLEYRLKPATVHLDGVSTLDTQLASFATEMNSQQLETETALRDVLRDVQAQTAALSRTVPIVAVPLILLCWFVLFLLVAALTEERAPELGLAKLRGYPLRKAGRFGRAETATLVGLAVPLGTALGLASVDIAARTMLSGGVGVELRWPVFASVAVCVVAAFVAIRFAGRTTLSKGVLALLRRTPERGRWSTGVIESVVAVLAAACIAVALRDQTSPLALLAPPLLAVVTGIGGARLLGLYSRSRVRHHFRGTSVSGLLAHAHMSRRRAGHRVMVVVTVAVALLSFAATAWSVAASARTDAADDRVGAQRVVGVVAEDPRALMAAVAAADPLGHSMAVVRVNEHYGSGTVEVIGVDTTRLAEVAVWRGHDPTDIATLAARLHPPSLPNELPVLVSGGTPADDPASVTFRFPAFGDAAQDFSVLEREDSLPRVGTHAVLMDLDYGVQAAQRSSSLSDNTRLHYEVWASAKAPADLSRRLSAAGLQILREQTLDGYLAELSHAAPALGLRLYLLAAAAAVLLALGAVLLTAFIGTQIRRYELAALRVTGVRAGLLRRSLLREYAHLLGLPLLLGLLAGVAGAAVMLPGIPLVTVGAPVGPLTYQPGTGVAPVAIAAAAVAVVVALLVMQLTVAKSTPQRLREGSR